MEAQTAETPAKAKRRDSAEYQEIKAHVAAYENDMKRLFNNRPDWKKLSRSMGILNVPTLIDDRLALQAKLKRQLS